MIRSGAPLALVLALVGAAGAAQDIGAVGAVNQRTTGQPPALPAPRQLAIADRVVRDERVVAGPDGAAQLMFLDQTTLSVGPNSEVVLDEYVYDPDAGTGAMAFGVARGALRFIGGGISKTTEVEARVPGAVIGLRGGMATILASEERTEFVFLAGQSARITAGDQTLTISRPGGRAVIARAPDGSYSVAYTGLATPEQTAALFRGVVSPGDGGRRVPGAPGDAAATAGAAFAPGGPALGFVSTSGARPPVEGLNDPAFVAVDALLAAQTAIFSDPALAGPGPTIDVGPDVALGETFAFLPFEFQVFDFVVSDGDTVNLSVVQGGQVLFSQLGYVLPAPNEAPLFTVEDARAGLLEVRLFAVNEGRDDPGTRANTGAIEVFNTPPGAPDRAEFFLSTGETGTFTVEMLPSEEGRGF